MSTTYKVTNKDNPDAGSLVDSDFCGCSTWLKSKHSFTQLELNIAIAVRKSP